MDEEDFKKVKKYCDDRLIPLSKLIRKLLLDEVNKRNIDEHRIKR